MSQDDVDFDDEDYINSETKDITILIDFKNAEITKNFSLKAKLELKDSKDEVILSTLKDTMKVVNIYNDTKDGDVTIYRDKSKTTLTMITCTKDSDTEQTIYIAELQ